MSLIDNFTKLFSRPAETVQKNLPAGMFGFFSPSALARWGDRDALLAYTGWVYACTNAIAERVADIELSLEVKQKDKWQQVEGHAALQLLHDVNPFTTFYDLVFLHEAFQQLNGNSFWVFNKNGAGQIVEIWQFDPTRFDIVKDKKNFISAYVYNPPSGDPIPLDLDEVLHFKRPNPNDPYRGTGTVQAAAIPIDTNKYAAEWQRNFFGNAAMPSGMLTTDGTLSQDQYDRLRAQWDAKYKGVANAHRMAIMEAGLKWQNLTPTSREMQFTESRKDLRDEILAIFKVPKPILGILDNVNLASASAVKELFAENVIRPRMKALVLGLNEFYLPMWKLDRTKYRFNFVDPVPQNIDTELQIINSGMGAGGIQAWMTPNEARERFGYEPIEGGDVLPQKTPATTTPDENKPKDSSQQEQDEQEEDVETEEDTDEENEDDKADKSVKKKAISKGKPIERSETSKKKEKDYKEEQIALLHETYLGLNTKLEKQLKKRIQDYTPEEKAIEDDTLIKRLLRQAQKDNIGQSNELVRWLFDTEEFKGWVGLVYNATKDGLTRILETAGAQTFADLNMEGSFDLENPRATSWLSQHAMEDSTSYSDTMKQEIASRVTDGVSQGLSNQKIADSISEFFDGQSDWRSMRIARTESINGYNQGTLQGFYQSKVVEKKFWIQDNEACPICVENGEAGSIPLDDDFPSGDPCPTAHPACECSLGGETNPNA